MLRRLIARPFHKCSFSQLKRLTEADLDDSRRRANGMIPVRDYMKWLNKPQVMVRYDFFNRKRRATDGCEKVTDFEPLFSHAMAKWLWTTYKLNDYPYFDLNIVTVFTNLPQCLDICQNTMKFFQEVLTEDQFNRINYFMVPLYKLDRDINATTLNDRIPGKIQIINDIQVSPFNGLGMETDHSNTFWVQDPVYIVLMDDVIKNLSHDQVRLNAAGSWEQGYLRFNSTGDQFKQEFHEGVDPLCAKTIDMLQENVDTQSMGPQYIPSQLIQLFDVINSLTPENRIFALDLQQHSSLYHPHWWWKTLFNKATQWAVDDDFYTGSSVLLNQQQEATWNHQNYIPMDPKPRGSITFAPNFKQIEQICLNFSAGANAVELHSLHTFMSQWYPEEGKLAPLASHLKQSQLRLIHSHLV